MTTIHSATAEDLTVSDPISEADLETFLGDAGMTHNSTMRNRMSVVDVDGSRKVRVTLAANSLDGVVFTVDLASSSEEIFCFYDLTANADSDSWEPGYGGKLPGPGAALPGYSPPSGGDGPESTGCDGRWMWLGWHDGGRPYSWVNNPNELVLYPYHWAQPGAYGNNQQTNTPIVPGQTHRLGVHYVMNTPGVADGVIRAYVDGSVVFENTAWEWRTDGDLSWNKFSFAVFRGGNDSLWEVDSATTFDFDNLVISTTMPESIDPPEAEPQGLGGLILSSQTTTTLTPTLAAPSVADPVLHTVAISHPTPTLSNGRPL